MQEHIRRAHPEHYIPKLPATEESFALMVNTPPHERPPVQQSSQSPNNVSAGPLGLSILSGPPSNTVLICPKVRPAIIIHSTTTIIISPVGRRDLRMNTEEALCFQLPMPPKCLRNLPISQMYSSRV